LPSIFAGGGRNTVARPSDINEQECADGENFDLRLGDSAFRPRKPFDKIATATNSGPIRGIAQLVRADNTTSTLVQAGDTVFEWDLGTTFTSKATISASSRLRGARDQNFTLGGTVIITDLEKQTEVSTWDGTTFATLVHDLGGSFFAKYAVVTNERVFYANITAGISIPHMVVGSGLLDPGDLTVADRPSSSLSGADPFFLLTLDLKPINGLVSAFGIIAFSTQNGKIYQLSGSSAQDFAVIDLFSGSNASGDEAMVNIGNDVLIGRRSAIDTLRSINTFQDVKTDDVSRWISDEIEPQTEWRIVYESNRQRAFCFPSEGQLVHVLHKPLFDAGGISPWSKWTTKHAIGFNPETVVTILGPDGIPTVYMGDSTGNLYRFDGTGAQDGGSEDITSFRLSPMVKGDPSGTVRELSGYIDYTRPTATLDIDLEVQWLDGDDQTTTTALPAETIGQVYGGGDVFYGGDFHYGAKGTGRQHRQRWDAAGNGHGFQIRSSVTAAQDFSVDEIFFEEAKA